MKIRNTKKYIESITRTQAVGRLGTPADPLYEKIEKNPDLDARIGFLTKFATNSSVQIFYELLQNAQDAKADRMAFYLAEKYLIVINNGEALRTDPPTNNVDAPKGQLFSFLSFGDKRRDADAIGKFGQGSKLLYDLIIPYSQGAEIEAFTENKLIETLRIGKAGPIIFSWNSLTQIEGLFNYDSESFELSGDLNDISVPLLFKVLYSYYPAYPGEVATLFNGDLDVIFTENELTCFIEALQIIRVPFEKVNYPKGVMIYIPLGNAQYENIRKSIDAIVIPGIRSSLPFLSNLKKIIINDIDIRKTDYFKRDIAPIFDGKNWHKVELAFPFSWKEHHQAITNFYQYFPISDTIYGLNFIINTAAYEIDQSRQNLDLSKKRNEQVVQRLSVSILSYLEEIKNQPENVKEYCQFLKCVLYSDDTRLSHNHIIKKLFDSDLLAFILKNLPTNNGIAPIDTTVLGKDSSLNIPLEDLGLSNQAWLNDAFINDLEICNSRLGIDTWSIVDVLESAPDRTKLSAWVLSLDATAYNVLVNEINDRCSTFSKLSSLPFIRFSDQSVKTLEEVEKDSRLFLLMPYSKRLIPVLRKLEVSFGENTLEAFPQLLSFVERQSVFSPAQLLSRLIPKLNENDLSPDEKWVNFETFNSNSDSAKYLESDLKIFTNQFGEKRPLSRLYYQANIDAPSGLLDSYELRNAENFFLHLKPWLLDKSSAWSVIIKEWNEEVLKHLRPENFAQIIEDMGLLFDAADQPDKMPGDIPWILTRNGEWASENSVFFDATLLMNYKDEKQYYGLIEFVERSSNLETIDYSNAVLLHSICWIDWGSCGFKTIKNTWKGESHQITIQQIKLIKDLHKSGEVFFNHFIIEEQNGNYYVRLMEKGTQFFIKDEKTRTFLWDKPGYYPLPEKLGPLFNQDDGLQLESDAYALNLISAFGATEEFIDMIMRRSTEVKREYLERIDEINLYSEEGPAEYRDEFEGKLLKIIAQEEWEDDFRSIIYIDDKPIDSYTFRDRIAFELEYDGQSFEVEYKLAELLPEFQGISDVVRKVLDKCKSIRVARLFDLENFPPAEIFAKLKSIEIDKPEQVSFIAAFSVDSNSLIWSQFSIQDDIDEIKILKAFYRNNIYFFNISDEIPFKSLHFDKLVFTDQKDLILEEEIMPYWLPGWIQSGDIKKKTAFLRKAGLKFDGDAVLEFRKKFKEGKQIDGNTIETLAYDWNNAVNTVEWIYLYQNLEFERSSQNYSSLQRLIGNIYETHGDFPKYIVSIDNISGNSVNLILKSISQENKCGYIKKAIEADLTVWSDVVSIQNIIIFDTSHSNFETAFFRELEKNSIYECELIPEFNADEIDTNQEWENRYYHLWKQKEENNFKIIILPHEIPLDFYLKYNNSNIHLGTYPKGEAERLATGGEVILYLYPDPKDDENVFHLLTAYKDKLFVKLSEKDLLIDLLGSLIRPLLPEQPESKGPGGDFVFDKPVTNEQFDKIKQNLSSVLKITELYSEDEISKIAENADIVKNLTVDQLGRLRENIDLVNQLLEKADSELLKLILENLDHLRLELEKEKKEPKPVALIGYIGERLIYQWLRKRGRDARYVGDHIWEYDIEFERNGREFKIDAKTTIGSILTSEDSIPFYVKKSQFIYIKNNPEVNYYIMRISLQDLGIAHIYEKYKNTALDFHTIVAQHGKEIDHILAEYLEKQEFNHLFQINRSTFRMNFPAEDRNLMEG